MKQARIVLLVIILGGLGLVPNPLFDPWPSSFVGARGTDELGTEVLRCVAFSPYVSGYNPDLGPHPPPSLIDTLLDVVVTQTGFRCIMTYGMLNGLDYTFEAAKNKGIKVIAIIWLDTDDATNNASIALGIQKAKQYPDTIIRLSCGSEVRVRHGAATAEPIIRNCINQLRAASVSQPITSIDTWWGWCNETSPCQQWNLVNDVDWIGINIFPWWENKYSGLFTCTPAAKAADFHIARIQDVIARYPQEEVVLTEFGWPAGPDGYRETNRFTGERCGVANEANQRLVVKETLAKLDQSGLSGTVFAAFREKWKETKEGPVGSFWGICNGASPYTCKFPYGFREWLYLPFIRK